MSENSQRRAETSRRHFLKTTGFAAVALRADSATAADHYPFATAEEAFAALDFDPSAAGNAFFAVAADCHYGINTDFGLLPIIEELNGMRLRPAFFLVDGDLAVSASISFGIRPNEAQKQATHEEFLSSRLHLDLLDKDIPLKLTLGNHDTSPDEDEPLMFHRVFPEHPAYQSFDLAGAHIVLLNGHGDGRIDAKQLDWFVDDITKIDPGQEVVSFVHQPSMASVVRERLIAPAYQQAFVKHRGNVWAICGHVHRNGDKVFALPETTVAQASITCSAKGIWGGPEKPGYWLYLLRDGKVAHRVFRQIDKGFRTGPLPDRQRAQTIKQPFGQTQGIVWKTLIGEGDAAFLVDGTGANNNVSDWSYIRRLVYRLPLAGNEATRLAILAIIPKQITGGPFPATIRLSGDNATWLDVPLPEVLNWVYTVDIPEALRDEEWIYVEVARPAGAASGIFVAGYALLT